MIGSILLMVTGSLLLLGVGQKAVRDFGIPSYILAFLCAVVVGLNFIPPLQTEKLSFSAGTAVLIGICLFIGGRGNRKNRLYSLFLTVLLSALFTGCILLTKRFGLSGALSYYHAFLIGFTAFLLTRNAQYAFSVSFFTVFSVGLACSGGTPVRLDSFYSLSLVASVFSATATSVFYFFRSKRKFALRQA